MPSPASRRLLRRGLIAVGAVLLVAGGLVAFVLLHAPGNVSHPNVQFTQPSATTTTSSGAAAARRSGRRPDTFVWPWYGFDAGRTRDFSPPGRLKPPFHRGWSFDAGALLEFPPVIWHGTMFMLGDDGVVSAIRTSNGRRLWRRKVGTLAAASPAVDGADRLIVLPVLSVHGSLPGGGQFVAISMRTGRILWSHSVPAGTESSPIIAGHTTYFGDQGGTLHALRLRDGHEFWTYHAGGAIKGGPALANGVLYFGDYAGRVHAVRAASGREVWTVGTDGARFGFGSGQFYATPAVAFGRVYIGNTDGRVYSFGARNGMLAWATGTGAYVYASAAVTDAPGLGPTVYVGSYDGYLYAFDARSGSVRWRHYAGAKISGAASVIDNVIYYSALRIRSTVGLDATTGRTVFHFGDGDFSPAIADDHALYVDGYSTVVQFLPGRRAPRAHRRPSRPRHRATPRRRTAPHRTAHHRTVRHRSHRRATHRRATHRRATHRRRARARS